MELEQSRFKIVVESLLLNLYSRVESNYVYATYSLSSANCLSELCSENLENNICKLILWTFQMENIILNPRRPRKIARTCSSKWWGMLCFGFVWGGHWWCRNLQRKWVGKTPETVWPGIGWSWFYCAGAVKSSSSGTENSIISKR